MKNNNKNFHSWDESASGITLIKRMLCAVKNVYRHVDTKSSRLRYLTLSMIFIFLIISPIGLSAQIWNFDGNNCDSLSSDEWGAPHATDGVDYVTGTADIVNFWGSSDSNYFYIAFDRVSSGNSGFTFYLNTDCDTTSGDTVRNGSEWAFFFNVSSGVVSSETLYEFNSGTGNYQNTGKSFDAHLGESVCGDNTTDQTFFEMRFPISDIFDVCDSVGNNCGYITVELGSTTAGGSPNSAVKDTFLINIPMAINLPPEAVILASDTVACAGDYISLNGTSSDHGNNGIGSFDSLILFEWDLDYDGVSFTADTTESSLNVVYDSTSSNRIALRVTDDYHCENIIDKTIEVFKRPEAAGILNYTVAPDPNCTNLNYNGKTSLDYTGLDNLSHLWNFGDGDSSVVDSGLHVYPDCNIYTVNLVVLDPDNVAKCASDTQVWLVALPVELTSLNAELSDDNTVLLTWMTATEKNNVGWEIERSSEGEVWSKVGFQKGSGFSKAIRNYSWEDKQPMNGLNYYRLKQLDYDGNVSYSKSRILHFSFQRSFVLYPNPAHDFITIEIENVFADDIDIIDQTGKEIVSYTLEPVNNGYKIDVSKLNSGFYYLRIVEHGRVSNKLFFVQ
jgi:hypothetical protein